MTAAKPRQPKGWTPTGDVTSGQPIFEIAVDDIPIDIEGDFQFPQIVKDLVVPWHQRLTRLAFRSRRSSSFRLGNWKR